MQQCSFSTSPCETFAPNNNMNHEGDTAAAPKTDQESSPLGRRNSAGSLPSGYGSARLAIRVLAYLFVQAATHWCAYACRVNSAYWPIRRIAHSRHTWRRLHSWRSPFKPSAWQLRLAGPLAVSSLPELPFVPFRWLLANTDPTKPVSLAVTAS